MANQEVIQNFQRDEYKYPVLEIVPTCKYASFSYTFSVSQT